MVMVGKWVQESGAPSRTDTDTKRMKGRNVSVQHNGRSVCEQIGGGWIRWGDIRRAVPFPGRNVAASPPKGRKSHTCGTGQAHDWGPTNVGSMRACVGRGGSLPAFGFGTTLILLLRAAFATKTFYSAPEQRKHGSIPWHTQRGKTPSGRGYARAKVQGRGGREVGLGGNVLRQCGAGLKASACTIKM